MQKKPVQLSLFPEKSKDFSKLQKDYIFGYVSDRSVYVGKQQLLPAKSQKVRNYSPDGFCWGYGGSGAAQLALAILLHYFDKLDAIRFHHTFKWEVIAELEQFKDFKIPRVIIDNIVSKYKYNTQ